MPAAILSFLGYLAAALVLLLAFVSVYVRCTPYKDFALIAHDNTAVAVTLAGAVLGFTIPMAASIYFTHSFLEMLAWAGITGAVQLAVFLVLRAQARRIEEGHVASAIMVATFSVAVGILSAASISS
jgi:putative membrane protein